MREFDIKKQVFTAWLLVFLLAPTNLLTFGGTSTVFATVDPDYGKCSLINGVYPCGGNADDWDNDGIPNDSDLCKHDPDRHCGIPEVRAD